MNVGRIDALLDHYANLYADGETSVAQRRNWTGGQTCIGDVLVEMRLLIYNTPENIADCLDISFAEADRLFMLGQSQGQNVMNQFNGAPAPAQHALLKHMLTTLREKGVADIDRKFL